MTPWPQASAAAQNRRLRRLAEAAVAAWDLSVTRLVRLDFWENATWRVDTPGGRYLLRLQRPAVRDPRELDAEHTVLTALAEAGFAVPRMVERGLGCWAPVEVPEVPGRWHAALLSWTEGRLLGDRARRAHVVQVGDLVGRLHRWALGWRAPHDLARPHVLAAPHGTAHLPEDHPVLDPLTAADRALLDHLAARFEDHGRRGLSGLVHLDLHFDNLVLTRDGLVAIDWDDCGYGSFLTDLAVPWCRARDLLGPDAAAHLLAAYRAHMPTPEGVEGDLALHYALGATVVPGWLAARWDTAAVRERAPRILARVMELLRAVPENA